MDRKVTTPDEFAKAIGIEADFMEIAHADAEADAVSDEYEQDLAESLIEDPDQL